MKNLFARGGIEFLAVLLGISGSLWIENNRESNLENEQIYNTLYSLKEELVTLQEYSERYKGKIIRDYNICDNILGKLDELERAREMDSVDNYHRYWYEHLDKNSNGEIDDTEIKND